MSESTEALHAALTEISGIGDARAREILDVLAAHDSGAGTARALEALDDAISYADQGDYEYAMQFVRDARDELA